MKLRTKRFSILPTLALALLVSACGDQFGAERLTGPEIQPVMSKAGNAENGKPDKAKDGKAKKDKKGPKVKALKKNGEEAEFRLAVSKGGSETGPTFVWLDAGSDATELRVGAHTLYLPAGLVDVPTKFSMRIEQRQYQNDEVITAVQLLATRTEGRGRNANVIDVGSQGFGGDTIRLCVSYAGVLDYDAEDLSGATLLWLQSNGSTHQVVDSQLDEANSRVCSERDHFSDYGLAWPTSR